MFVLKQAKNSLFFQNSKEELEIKAFGNNCLRIRSKPRYENSEVLSSSLFRKKVANNVQIKIFDSGKEASIQNGELRAHIKEGVITFFKNENIILQEYIRKQTDVRRTIGVDEDRKITSEYSSSLNIAPREFIPNYLGDYKLNVRFEADSQEKIYGMGLYQEDILNLQYTELELMHRNSQTSIPFYISSKKYGFMWANPGVGNVSFAKNKIEWSLKSTKYLEYWIFTGEDFEEIHEEYSDVTGKAPRIDKNLLGLWQSKLRYQTRKELVDVYNQYIDRNIKPSVMVIDYFHWTADGDYRFDEEYWPKMEEVVEKFSETNTEIMVSIWPTVQKNSKYYNDYSNLGYLIGTERMENNTFGNSKLVDMTNPEARNFVWDKIEHNYYSKGIRMFWADQAEPEYSFYTLDNYRYYLGKATNYSNIYPRQYAKMIFDGKNSRLNDKTFPTLIRSAWLGSQKYGIILWSGDIDSSFESFKIQVKSSINASMSGIPYVISDIGGFHGGDKKNKVFRELIVRWFQYAVFTPILRMHGDRQPHTTRIGSSGGGLRTSGDENEIWSYGIENEKIFTKWLSIREEIRSEIEKMIELNHNTGKPLLKPLFYDYSHDDNCWLVEDQYMFGKYLVAPIFEYGQRRREVYLPSGTKWKHYFSNEIYEGGEYYIVEAPLEETPVFMEFQ